MPVGTNEGGVDLLPCPFCGAEGRIQSLIRPAGKLFWGECTGEEKCVALNAKYERKEAVSHWNTRAALRARSAR